ncbi:MAG: cysteine methyltransferase [Chitinophagaceae bacterium]
MFKDWAGVSPKKFLQFLIVEYAQGLLKKEISLLDTAYETGLSSPSRLHDLFISIEEMSPGVYKSRGENLEINYSFAETIFGDVIIASTSKRICYLNFLGDKKFEIATLEKMFPKANLQQKTDMLQQKALQFFSKDRTNLTQLKLHLKGTGFQVKVWQSLLKIPLGEISTNFRVAAKINSQHAAKAVGAAIGSNPVAFLIPCHRIIKSSGCCFYCCCIFLFKINELISVTTRPTGKISA